MKSLFLIIVINVVSVWSYAHCEEYDFPITHRSPEWPELSFQERVQSQQIPYEILQNIKTVDLFYTNLHNLTHRVMLHAFNTYQDGYKWVKDNLNMASELVNRPDLGDVLVHEYLQINEPTTEAAASLDLWAFELLLAQPEVLDKLSKNQKKELVSNTISIANRESPFVAGEGLVLLCAIMLSEKYEPFCMVYEKSNDLKYVLETKRFLVMQEIDDKTVISMASNYLHE